MKTILQKSVIAAAFALFTFNSSSIVNAQIQVDADGVGASGIGFLTKVGNKMFYYGTNEASTSQFGLFSHDGTTPTYVKQLCTITDIPNIKTIHDGYGKAYFHFNSNNASTINGLVVSDGTDAGTMQIFACQKPEWYANCNGKVFFSTKLVSSNDEELFVTDGTAAGTFRVKDIYPGNTSSQPNGGVEFKNEFWFRALTNTASGYQLYKSDGTEAGTSQFVYPAALSGRVNHLYVHNGYLYFTGQTTVGSKSVLWRTDGTTAGTEKIFEGNDAIGTFGIINSLGNILLGFSSNITVSPAAYSLYAIDAVTLDTSLLKTGVLITGGEKGWMYDNKIVFVGSSPAAGLEPWITDGTTAGTFMLKDITPGTASTNIYRSVAYSNNEFYINTQQNGIWKTDGTIAGTTSLGIQPDNNYNTSFLSLNNEVFYLKDSPGRVRKIHKLGAPATSIESVTEQNNVLVYPNPSNGVLYVSNKDNQAVRVVIYNALGAKVYENQSNDNNAQINLANQPKGLYSVRFDNGKEMSTQKLLIQ